MCGCARNMCGYMQNVITSATDTAIYTSFRSITNKEKKKKTTGLPRLIGPKGKTKNCLQEN